MKRLLLLFLIVLGARNIQAQDCIGYIPEDAILICDTTTYIQQSNSSYWFAKDSTWAYMSGDSNTVYANYPNCRIGIWGDYNKVYFTGPNALVLIGIGSHNEIHIGTGTVELSVSDSTIIYGTKIYLNSPYNVIAYVDTIINYPNPINDPSTNSYFYPNPCPGVQISTLHAPFNNCSQTTGIIEDAVSINIYPTPATDNVTFNLQNAGEIKTITIYDITGKTVEVLANINTDKITIDTSKLSTGMYVYSITLANGKTERGKLLVG